MVHDSLAEQPLKALEHILPSQRECGGRRVQGFYPKFSLPWVCNGIKVGVADTLCHAEFTFQMYPRMTVKAASIDTGPQRRSLVPPSLVSAVGPAATPSIPNVGRSDGHRVSSVELAVPHDAIVTWEVSGRQQDSSEPVTGGGQKHRFAYSPQLIWVWDPESEISTNITFACSCN